MRLRISVVVATVIAAAAGISVAAFVVTPEPPLASLPIVLGLGCFALVAELLDYRMPQGGQGSIAIIPFLAIALMATSWHGIAVVAAVELAVQAMRKRPPLKLVFNVAQASLSVAVGSLVYGIAGGDSFANADSFQATVTANASAALLSLAGVAFTNTVSVSAVIAASNGDRFAAVWRRNTLGTLAYLLLAWPFACGLAWVYAQKGALTAIIAAIPMLGARQLYITTLKLQQTSRELLELMVKAIEARDPYTSGHSRRVSQNAAIIARGLSLSSAQVERVRVAGLLHDIGKIHEDFAPILRKEGKLTAAEWEVMKTHSAKGADLISTLSDLRDIESTVRHHHENWDGTGYPSGIAGEQIPLFARVITLADTIDALTTDRPYRPARTEEQVRAELVRCRGSQFDPSICDVVLSQTIWSQLFPESVNSKLASPPKGVQLVKVS